MFHAPLNRPSALVRIGFVSHGGPSAAGRYRPRHWLRFARLLLAIRSVRSTALKAAFGGLGVLRPTSFKAGTGANWLRLARQVSCPGSKSGVTRFAGRPLKLGSFRTNLRGQRKRKRLIRNPGRTQEKPNAASGRLSSSFGRRLSTDRMSGRNQNTIAEKTQKRKRGRSPEGPFLVFLASHSHFFQDSFLRFLRLYSLLLLWLFLVLCAKTQGPNK